MMRYNDFDLGYLGGQAQDKIKRENKISRSSSDDSQNIMKKGNNRKRCVKDANKQNREQSMELLDSPESINVEMKGKATINMSQLVMYSDESSDSSDFKIPEEVLTTQAKPQQQQQQQKQPLSQIKCNNCKEFGHMRRQCPVTVTYDYAQCEYCLDNHDYYDCLQIICRRCNQLGHYAKDCTAKYSQLRCRRCAKGGHLERDCQVWVTGEKSDLGELVCLVCGQKGHVTCQEKYRKKDKIFMGKGVGLLVGVNGKGKGNGKTLVRHMERMSLKEKEKERKRAAGFVEVRYESDVRIIQQPMRTNKTIRKQQCKG